MVGWHHRLSGHKFEQTQRDIEGQGGLVCCRPWAARSQTQLKTEQLYLVILLNFVCLLIACL